MNRRAELPKLLGVFGGCTLLPIAIGHLAKLDVVLRLTPIAYAWRLLLHVDARALDIGVVATEGLMPIAWTLFWFILGGAVVGAIARRPPLFEVMVGAGVVAIVQLVLWLHELSFDLPLLGLDAVVGKKNGPALEFALRSNATLLLVEISVVSAIAATCASIAAAAVSVHISKEAACRACHRTYDARAGLEACPHCKAVLVPSGLAWSWIAGSVGATVLLFVIVLRVAGPTVDYFHRCDVERLGAGRCSEIVREANREIAKGESPTWLVFGIRQRHDPQGDRFLNVLQPWLYLAVQSIAFFPAPFAVAWKVKKKGRVAALVTLGISIFLSIVVGVTILLSGGGGEGFAAMLVRIHVFGVVLWTIVGFVAAVLGGKRRYSREAAYLEDIESSKKA